MNIAKTTLYTLDAMQRLREWSIESVNWQLIITHGIQGGAMQTQVEEVPVGLAARTREEQLRSRYVSRIKAQLDRGYVEQISSLEKGVVNSLGFCKPMLAQPREKVIRPIDYSTAFTQFKYDGHRCLITKHQGEIIAYSRGSKLITSIPHILCDLELCEGETIDGELYAHGESLQSITSFIRKHQEGSAKLLYHAYDYVDPLLGFQHRLEKLRTIKMGDSCLVVPTIPLESPAEITERFVYAKQAGYEGIMIRWGNAGYETGKRSYNLVKVKSRLDEDFRVLDVLPSVDGWGILVCALGGDRTFRVTAPGTVEEKIHVLMHKYSYIGKMVEVEFANWTPDHKPFHPVAVRFKDYV